VIFLVKKEFSDHFVEKEHVGEIKKIEGSRITITTGGRDVVVPMDVYNHIDHSYCRTTYRVQGADFKNVIANLDTRQSLMNCINDYLVKTSRAVENLVIYTNDRYNLYEAVNREQFKVSINDFKSEFYRKDENKIISKWIEEITKRDYETSKLPKKVIDDLKRGDDNYIKYLQLKLKADIAHSKADSLLKGRFQTGKVKHVTEEKVLNYLEIEKKAAGYKQKSEFFYRKAITKFTAAASREVNIGSGLRFEKAYIPDEISESLGDFKGDRKSLSLTGIDSKSLEVEGTQFYVEVPPGIGQEGAPPGIDSPGDDGIIPGGDGSEGIEGGEGGPGISLDF